jgi:hypothetical protein
MRAALVTLVLAASMAGCGGGRAHAPPAVTPPASAPVNTPPPSVETRDQGLEFTFTPGVREQEAVKYVLRCVASDPAGQPAAASFTCPANLGAMKMDIREGPGGTSLMLFTGDPKVSEDLRRWFEEHKDMTD